MFIKPLRVRCQVRGCTNIGSYAISKIGDFSGIKMCDSCIKETYEALFKNEQPKTIEVAPKKPLSETDIDIPKKTRKTKKDA